MSTTTRVVSCLLAGAILSSSLTAQHAADAATQGRLAQGLTIPIHEAPADDTSAPPRLWAAGTGYKVSFHDGFAFYPQLGADATEPLPLRWRTESITVGGKAIVEVGTEPEHSHGPWRYEFRWPGVTEAYDVRAEGVEQTFVIAERPTLPGDLVVTGRVDTHLVPQMPVASGHAAITYADAKGQPLVRYGEAFAVDALGRRAPLTTTCAGPRIALTVPAAYLQTAAFPLTIDPLTSSITLQQADFRRVSVERQNETIGGNVLVTYTLRHSSGDHDAFAVVYDDTFLNPVMVFADLDVTRNSIAQDSTYAGGSDRWVIAYTTAIAGVPMRGRLYFHTRGNTTINSGPTKTVLGNDGAEVHDSLALGGSEVGQELLLAYGTSGSSNTGVWTAIVAAGTSSASIGTRVRIAATSDDPEVSRSNSSTDSGWLLTYSAIEGSLFDQRTVLYALRVTPTNLGGVTPVAIVTDTGFSNMGRTLVDGRDGRFLMAYERRIPFSLLFTRRIDWPAAATTPTIHTERSVNGALGAFITWGRGLAYDKSSRSHWCLACGGDIEQALRLGGDGTIVEVANLGASTVTPAAEPQDAVTFNDAAREFQVAYITTGTSTSTVVAGRRLQYSPDAINVGYGTGCNDTGVAIGANRPDAGSEFFTVGLAALTRGTPTLPNGTTCALLLSLAPASVLDSSGCRILVDLRSGRHLVNLPATLSLGRASARYPLLQPALFGRDLFGQWAFVTPQGLRGTSAGLRMQVR